MKNRLERKHEGKEAKQDYFIFFDSRVKISQEFPVVIFPLVSLNNDRKEEL